MDRKYVAFISYRHKPLDIAVARQLHSLIEQYHIPRKLRRDGKRRLGLAFRDQEELPLCPNLPDNIRTALENSEYLVVVCTPDTNESNWVKQEIDHFLACHGGDRNRVFLVLAEGEASEVFPKSLTQITDPLTGAVTELEPLAANIVSSSPRQRRRKLRSEVLRLFAAILGCHYDALVQREQRRQRRRILAVSGAVLTVTLAFCAVLLVKNHQIRRANEALDTKSKQVQMHESELLTQNAAEALAAGDYAAAIRDAVAALPADEQDDRPYYAPAEQVLISALDIQKRREDSDIIMTTTLEQTTGIANFMVSDDGTRLVTLDLFGVFHCFDTISGKLLWSVMGGGSGTCSVYDDGWTMVPTPDGTGFISLCGGVIESRRFDDGRLLWSTGYLSLREDCLIQSGGRRYLAYTDFDPEELFGTAAQRLTILDCATGAVVQQLDAVDNVEFLNTYSLVLLHDTAKFGAFSPDGKYFAGVVPVYQEGIYKEFTYVADLQSGTARILRTRQMEALYNTCTVDIAFDGDGLLVTRLSPDGALGGGIERIDLQSGEILWQVFPEEEDAQLYIDSDPLRVIHREDVSYLYRGKGLYAIDREQTQWVCSGTFDNRLAGMEVLQDRLLSCITTDGSYRIIWQGEDGFHSSAAFGTSVRLGETQQVRLWQEGFLRGEFDADTLVGLSMAAPGEDRGFAAAVSADENNRIRIFRARALDPVEDMTRAVIAGDEESAMELYSFLGNGNLILGSFDEIHLEDDALTTRRFVAVDAESLELKEEFYVDSRQAGDYHFLTDLSGYVNCTASGDISFYDAATGEKRVLSESETEQINRTENVTYLANLAEACCVRRNSDGALVTVKCTRDGMTIWTNGAEPRQISLPEDLIWQMQYRSTRYNRLLQAGENGYVVISSFEEDDSLMDGFAAYDTVGGSWLRFPDAGDGEPERGCCLAAEEPLFAVADMDGTLRVYHLKSGEVIREFSLNLSAHSILQMIFACNDTVLVVKTGDERLLVYDIAAGQQVYQEIRSTDAFSSIAAYTDSKNGRLYISDSRQSDRSGLCLDTGSWTKLCDIAGFLCYDPKADVIYSHSGSPQAYLIRKRIPSTLQLVQMGRELLKNP